MAGKETMGRSRRKYVRQPPAVPFLWEEKPGIAKRDWRQAISSVSPIQMPPVKLIASIPFNWEEKPGTPLNSLSHPPLESEQQILPENLMTFPSPPESEPSNLPENLITFPSPQVLPENIMTFPSPPESGPLPILPENLTTFPSPTAYPQGYDVVENGKEEVSDNGQDDQKALFELDLEAFDFETDGSFSSSPSLLANCLVPSVAISSAVPVEKSSLSDDISDEPNIPSTPDSETDSSTSSYTNGFSSLVGASFLECLFPLLPPKAGFLERVGCSEMGPLTQPVMKSKEFDDESNSSVVIRRPTTLGELIMISRRRSYQMKAAQIRKQNLSMEFARRASGCCIFGTSIKMIEGLQRKKCQLML
ncbi:uncharacterized protein LOC116116335 [Pistacia vera]|uniref:uncharacterized protein LOC116116335 n=1 Tax=Pistacia vera TaxID=55513 RepID=UPI00126326DD|nr:uncharacterized protein LOC116116335 [Pistacia vera]